MKKGLESKLLIGLVIALSLLGLRGIFVIQSGKKKMQETRKKLQAEAAVAAVVPAAADNAKILAYVKRLNWNRDPFGSVGGTTPEASAYSYKKKEGELHLGGIMWDEARPLAIVDGVMMKEGDVVDGKEIIKIYPDGILIKEGDKENKILIEK